MINPSANGWIDKFFLEQGQLVLSENHLSFYEQIRKTGFIYGHIISINTPTPIDISQWKSDEISKVALVNTLYSVYCFANQDANPNLFIEKTVAFYNEMNQKEFSFFKNIIPSNASNKLESLIND